MFDLLTNKRMIVVTKNKNLSFRIRRFASKYPEDCKILCSLGKILIASVPTYFFRISPPPAKRVVLKSGEMINCHDIRYL